jgi:transposase
MRVEVLGGVERRRRWSRDDKMRIIEETLAPGAVVTEIARRHGISTSLVFTWRRRARLASVVSAGPRLVPVQLTPVAAESVPSIEAPAAIPSRNSNLQPPTPDRQAQAPPATAAAPKDHHGRRQPAHPL